MTTTAFASSLNLTKGAAEMLTFVEKEVDEQIAEASVRALLSTQLTAAFAVSDTDILRMCSVYIAAALPAVYFTSQPVTRHVAALKLDPRAGLAVWETPLAMGDLLYGVQLHGQASVIEDEGLASRGLDTLHRRFSATQVSLPRVSDLVGPQRKTALIEVVVVGGTLIHEAVFGLRRFLDFRVDTHP
jgi:hypothetical protein